MASKQQQAKNRNKVAQSVNSPSKNKGNNQGKPNKPTNVPGKPGLGGKPGGGGGGNKPGGGATFVPGTPGTPPSPPAPPFKTSDNIFAEAEARRQYEQRMLDVDAQLARQNIDTQYQAGQIDKGAAVSRRDTNDAAAARGIFRSSLRDADLFDIDATAAIKKDYLNRQLDTSTLNAQSNKTIAQTAYDTFMAGLNQAQAENAQSLGPGDPGTPGTPGTYINNKTNKPTPNTPSTKVTAGPAKTPRPQGFGGWTQARKQHWLNNHPGS